MSDDPTFPTIPTQPSAPRKPTPWRTISVIALSVIAAAGSVGFIGWTLRARMRQLRNDAAALEQRRQVTERQLGALKQQHDELMRGYQQTTSDRDNLLAQLKRIMEEQSRVATDRDLFEGVLKRVSEEDFLLRDKLESMKADHERLQELADALLTERDTLQTQLTKSKTRSGEKRLKDELAKEKTRHRQETLELAATKRKLSALTARQAKTGAELTKTTRRLSLLQERYGALLAEHRVAQHRLSAMPKSVTSIAREHERLLKEVADTHYNMGVLFTKKDDYTRAVKEFHKVVELRPADADALYNLGVIYAEHLPDRERATTYFRRYLQLNPSAKDASWVKQYIASWNAWEAKERLE